MEQSCKLPGPLPRLQAAVLPSRLSSESLRAHENCGVEMSETCCKEEDSNLVPEDVKLQPGLHLFLVRLKET